MLRKKKRAQKDVVVETLRLDMDRRAQEGLERLMVKCGVETKVEVIRRGLALLDAWGSERFEELVMPNLAGLHEEVVCAVLNRLFMHSPRPARIASQGEWAEYWLGELRKGPGVLPVKGIVWDGERAQFVRRGDSE